MTTHPSCGWPGRDAECAPNQDNRRLGRGGIAGFHRLIGPAHGSHRPPVSDRLCLRGPFLRLVTGSLWVEIEAILDHQVSDTTLRAPPDEWITAGAIVRDGALAAFNRIIGFALDDPATDGSRHRPPIRDEGTGTRPTAASAPGRGPSPPTDTASRSGGPPTAPTATTSASSSRPSTPSRPPASINPLRCADSTGSTPAPRPAASSPHAPPLRSTSAGAAPGRHRTARPGSRSGGAGSSRPRTRGGRPTPSSATAPTARVSNR